MKIVKEQFKFVLSEEEEEKYKYFLILLMLSGNCHTASVDMWEEEARMGILHDKHMEEAESQLHKKGVVLGGTKPVYEILLTCVTFVFQYYVLVLLFIIVFLCFRAFIRNVKNINNRLVRIGREERNLQIMRNLIHFPSIDD